MKQSATTLPYAAIRILSICEPGEQRINPNHSQNRIEWHIGKLLSYGRTKTGFAYAVFESTNFGSIVVWPKTDGEVPKSRLRNDASANIRLNTLRERAWTAEKMVREIVY